MRETTQKCLRCTVIMLIKEMELEMTVRISILIKRMGLERSVPIIVDCMVDKTIQEIGK